MAETTPSVPKIAPLVPSRQALYSQISKYAPWAIEQLVILAETATNDSVRASALNKILDKSIPDLKGVEIKGENGEPIKLQLIAGSGYIPKLVAINATSEERAVRETGEVQSTDLAQTGAENNHSDNGTS